MKLSILIAITMLLAGCLGPELFTIGGFKVTAGTAITVPAKIEAYEKYKEEKEKKEYKQEEHKKRFEMNKLDEKTFEIYY
jgi:hypothetical protein